MLRPALDIAMTDAEKELTRDVVAWFSQTWGMGTLRLKATDFHFLTPELDDDYKPDTFAFSRARWLRATGYALLFGLLFAVFVFLWAGWFSPVNILFFALTFALVWFFPVLAVVLRERAIIVYYGPGLERELAHQVALAYLNSHPVRECLHALMDVLLFPFVLSYQEGLAAWFAEAYLRDRGEVGNAGLAPLRARGGRRLAWLVGKLAGRRALRFLLRYC
ncbi:MAG: hypothetical protein KKB70_06995 [Proteobacteria bacterium]|nr:hypothetical protein [Pseudomonadota bacterium]MBU1612722.1 hypothetical protein [Pseudomonadota bacterium]